jgi:hypothetical protein
VNRLLKDWGRSNEIVYKPKAIRRWNFIKKTHPKRCAF